MKDANSKKDWSRAEQFYYQAVDVFPEGAAHIEQGICTQFYLCSILHIPSHLQRFCCLIPFL